MKKNRDLVHYITTPDNGIILETRAKLVPLSWRSLRNIMSIEGRRPSTEQLKKLGFKHITRDASWIPGTELSTVPIHEQKT